MASGKSKSQSEVEASLEPEQRRVFNQLVEDYREATGLHVPTYKGGPSFKILGELVRRGWRKSE